MTSMFRSYALTMTRPYEQLGMPIPFIRQLKNHAYIGWYVAVWFALFIVVLTYIGFITTGSAKGFQLRDAESRIERLQSEARGLEMQVATLSSVASMRNKVGDMGFVAITSVTHVNAVGSSYAFAR